LKVPICEPVFTGSELKFLSHCVRSRVISRRSKYVSEFESQFAKYCGCKYGVATNSGTTALHLGAAAAGVKQGHDVIVPTFTMIATANAVVYQKATPVLVDSENESWNIDPTQVDHVCSKRTTAILLTHIYGHPANMDPIKRIAAQKGLMIIEDAAEAHGAEYKGRRAGSLGDLGCFSFYSNKIITTGEGGMVVTNSRRIYDRARQLVELSFGRGVSSRYIHSSVGFSYCMTGLQAAVGLAQMSMIDEFVEARRRHAALYNSLLDGTQGITTPPEMRWAKNGYWLYTALIDDEEYGLARDRLIEKLAEGGVETRPTFYPLHRQPALKELARKHGRYPVADLLSRNGINLPSGSGLTDKQIIYVCKLIKSFARK